MSDPQHARVAWVVVAFIIGTVCGWAFDRRADVFELLDFIKGIHRQPPYILKPLGRLIQKLMGGYKPGVNDE